MEFQNKASQFNKFIYIFIYVIYSISLNINNIQQ